jgi:hypothetical protein
LTHPETEMPLLALCSTCPFRVADWRWRLAVRVAQGRFTPRRWVDRWTVRALPLARSLMRPPVMGGRLRRARTPSAIDLAYQLYCRRESFQRWEVEARLLAGEDFNQVAAKYDCGSAMVEAYHALFFQVQDRLRATDYITTSVIGRKLHAGLTADDVDVLMKVFGYGGGPLVLEAAIRYFRRPLLFPGRWDGLDADFLGELRGRLPIQGAILALTAPAEAKGLKKLEALQEALQALAGPGANDALAAGVLQAAAQFEVDLAQALTAPPAAAPGAAAVVDHVEVGAGDPATSAARREVSS